MDKHKSNDIKELCFSDYIGDVNTNGSFIKQVDTEYSFYFADGISYEKEGEILDKHMFDCNKFTRKHKNDKSTNYKTISSKAEYNVSIDVIGEDRLVIAKEKALRLASKKDIDFVLNNYKTILTQKQINYLDGKNKSKNRHHRYANRIKRRFEKYITIDDKEKEMMEDIKKEFEEASCDNDAFINFVLKYYNEDFMYNIMYSNEMPNKVKKAFNKRKNGKSRHKGIKVKYLNYIYDLLFKFFKMK